MLVFIDDSGDPGFKLLKGSSPIFVIALVIFDDQPSGIKIPTILRSLKSPADWIKKLTS